MLFASNPPEWALSMPRIEPRQVGGPSVLWVLSYVAPLTVALALGSFGASQAHASPTPQEAGPAEETTGETPRARGEVGLILGYATGKVFDPARTRTNFQQIGVRWVPSVTTTNRVAFVLEVLPLFTMDQDPRATGGGLNLLARIKLANGTWRPAIIGGIGMLFANTEVPPGETRFNYTPQVGVSIQRLLGRSTALNVDYRFHHISNTGFSTSNPGINSHLVTVGLSFFL